MYSCSEILIVLCNGAHRFPSVPELISLVLEPMETGIDGTPEGLEKSNF